MADGMFQKVDCFRLAVDDLDEALIFYGEKLGHRLNWRTDDAIGLAMPQSETELVLHLGDDRGANLLVEHVDEAADAVTKAGGKILTGPFDIDVGRCAVVADPWNNVVVLLDLSKGTFETDAEGRVVGLAR